MRQIVQASKGRYGSGDRGHGHGVCRYVRIRNTIVKRGPRRSARVAAWLADDVHDSGTMPAGQNMRFSYTRCDSLPRLGWCAHLRRGSGVARVYHGPWVETRDDWFVEGAWTGQFERGELDKALFLVGSGGVVRSGRAVFCTQTDMIERLYSIRAGDDLFMSNSMAFVLAMTGDEPDPCYPFYARKLRRFVIDGICRKRKVLRTRLGRRVELHEYCQVAVSDDLRLVRIEKPAFRRPASFEDYRSMLHGVLGAVLENAASPERRHRRYEGLAMVSGGYDSNAVAALLSGLGVREAMTIYDGRPGVDSGEEVARLLGMAVRAYGRTDFRVTPGIDEAEFLSWPDQASDIVLAACFEQLVGKVLVAGRYGDVVFDSDPSKMLNGFRLPRDHAVGGSRMLEFRLRCGFFNFNPLFTGGLHLSAMRGITTSHEMTPWRLEGSYDRPIPRRILEEAGVPRGMFGVTKRKSAYYVFRSLTDLSASGRADFESYRRSMPRPGLLFRGLVKIRSTCETAARATKRVWWTGGKTAESLIPLLFRVQAWDDMNFAMHWGQARVRPRYGEAVKARAACAAGSANTALRNG